jgi:hypothetical protein
MADTAPVFFKEEIPETNEIIRFESRDEFANWLEELKRRWAPVMAIKDGSIAHPIRPGYSTARGRLDRFFNIAQQASSNGNVEQFRRELRQFATETRLPLSKIGLPEFLIGLIAQRGPSIAAAAFAHFAPFRPDVSELTHADGRVGIGAAIAFLLGVEVSAKTAVDSAMSELAEKYRNEISNLERLTQNAGETSAAEIEASHKALSALRESQSEQLDKALAEFRASGDQEREKLEALRNAYNEQMHLQAPVEYWRSKARSHRTSEDRLRTSLFLYTPVASLALFFALAYLTQLASGAGLNGNIALYIKYAAIGVVCIAIVLWIGRILLRFLISERHLAIDSEERVTMVMTYLALTNDGKLQEQDRPLVLGPLFRSGSDGIVKDDGTGPDTLVTSIIAKVLDRAAR